MSPPQASLVLQHLRGLVGAETLDQQPDRQLLERFLTGHEEAAFEALVRRHGPLVLGLCRRLLPNWHDAEDAFQATFWVLARKASSIRKQASVGSWLYQVAYRAAVKARARAAAQQQHERQASPKPAADALAELTGRELLAVLDEELHRLPERLRAPLILCYLEGRTRDEAAQQLGWSRGTLKRRLEQGRESLRTRLARRGLALPAAILTAGLTEGTAAAAVSPLLVASIKKTALQFAAGKMTAAGLGGQAAELAQTILKTMSGAKLTIAGAALLTAVVLVLGVTAFTQQGPGPRPGEGKTGSVGPALPRQKQQAKSKGHPVVKKNQAKPEPGKMLVAGRVVDAAGKAVPHAKVVLVIWPKDNSRGGDFSATKPRPLVRVQADREGRFQLNTARPSSTRLRSIRVLAAAKGFAVGWHQLNPDAEKSDTVLKLLPDQVIRGRLVDLQGGPAVGVRVSVSSVGHSANGEFNGISFWDLPDRRLSVWPVPATTDAKGRFVIPGVNRSQGIALNLISDRFAPQRLNVAKDPQKQVTGALSPAQIIQGTVVYADTGKRVPHARLTVYSKQDMLGSAGGMDGKADARGHFRLNAFPGKFFDVTAYAPDGEPYLTLQKELAWPRGAVKHEMQLALPRGVLVRGKVTESPSGKPVAGASIQFIPRHANNSFYRSDVVTGWQGIVVSGADGVFRTAVLPGPGHLLVSGPTLDYVHEEIGSNVLYNGKPGGTRYYPDALIKLDLPAQAKTKEIAATLRRGVTVKGRLLLGTGKPVAKGLMMCRLHVSALSPFWRFPVEVRDGRFELHGCDPKQSYPVYFLDPKNKWGKVVTLSGNQAGKAVTVRLEACGTARVRFVNARGEAVAHTHSHLDMVITPGVHRYDFQAAGKGLLAADGEMLANIDRHNYWNGPMSDSEGRSTLTALIPGATYRLVLKFNPTVVIKDFTVAAGKTMDLGNQTIETRD